MDTRPTRRRFVAAALTGVSGVLAGCNGGESGEPTGSPAGSPTGVGTTPGGDGDTDGGGGGTASLSNVLTPGNSFAMEIRAGEGDQRTTITGRFSGGNSYQRIESSESEIETYRIDGDVYMITGDTCFLNPGDTMEPDVAAETDPEAYQTESDLPEVTASGRTTIEGTEVYVFDVSADQASGDRAATYYVAVDSGYLRRVESGATTIDFSSYGNVDPVQPPEMECQEMPSGQPSAP